MELLKRQILSATSIFIVIYITTLIAGCISNPISPNLDHNTITYVDYTNREQYNFISLEEPLNDLLLGQDKRKHNITIYTLEGIELDQSGNAKEWILGISQDGTNYLVTYTSQGKKLQKWPGTFTGKPISLEKIILPSGLFEQRAAIIKGMVANEEIKGTKLSLKGDYYVLENKFQNIITLYRFDAKNGALISENEIKT